MRIRAVLRCSNAVQTALSEQAEVRKRAEEVLLENYSKKVFLDDYLHFMAYHVVTHDESSPITGGDLRMLSEMFINANRSAGSAGCRGGLDAIANCIDPEEPCDCYGFCAPAVS